jgi:hypothetical protein
MPAANDGPYVGSAVFQYSGIDGSLLQIIDTEKVLTMAPGPTGEEMFLTINYSQPNQRGLARINLVTGVQSSIPKYPQWFNLYIPYGDPTGWNWARIIDPQGDNDGDGHKNFEETQAGSNPYDAQSRPDGPKVYLWFLPGTNAIALRFMDRDGLLNPAYGLDLTSLKLLAGPYGDILPLLWSFVSKVTVSPAGDDATVEFGNLPIPSNLKLRLDVEAADKTGAKASDWQITPPGVG